MRLYQLRKQGINEEIDSLFLYDKFKNYAYPRNKIKALLDSKELIRVKKGIYIFGEDLALQPYCKETLANLIYGPSAISLEYALSFYGMIPERVPTITSITNKRNKTFNTPVGDFTYKYINPGKYPIGINLFHIDKQHSVLIASREKALADMLMLTLKLHLANIKELQEYLFDNLRIDESQFAQLNRAKLGKIAKVYKNHNVDLLANYLEKKHE